MTATSLLEKVLSPPRLEENQPALQRTGYPDSVDPVVDHRFVVTFAKAEPAAAAVLLCRAVGSLIVIGRAVQRLESVKRRAGGDVGGEGVLRAESLDNVT